MTEKKTNLDPRTLGLRIAEAQSQRDHSGGGGSTSRVQPAYLHRHRKR